MQRKAILVRILKVFLLIVPIDKIQSSGILWKKEVKNKLKKLLEAYCHFSIACSYQYRK